MSTYFDTVVGDVRSWGWEEVQQWVKYCGFTDEKVLSNIERFKIDGKCMLTAEIPANELGVIDTQLFEIRMRELVLRNNVEQSRKYGSCFDAERFDFVNEDETGFDRF
jgi:hypothetical protein